MQSKGMTRILAVAFILWPLAVVVAETDYSKLPPDFGEFGKKLAENKVTLASAIAAAEKRVNGKAFEATVELVDGKLVMLVTVVAPGLTAQIKIDPTSGEVAKDPYVVADMNRTLLEAIAQAEKKAEGKATSARIILADTKPKPGPGEEQTTTKPAKDMMEIEVLGNTARKRISVDPSNGETTKSEDLSLSRFPGEPVKGEPTKTPSGLMYYDIKVGDGEKPAPESIVEVHYSGWFVDGKEFDSSVKRGRPATFPLNRVIPGWTEGVGSMKVGGKRKLLIPANLAYGSGRGPIPPNATLIFDVELLSAKAAPPPMTRPAMNITTRPGAGRVQVPPPSATRPAGNR